VCDGVRGEVRARKVTSTANGEVGRDRGDGAASRRSLARRHGWRRARRPRLADVYVTCTAWCLGRLRTRRATLWRPCVRSRPRRHGHPVRGGGAASTVCSVITAGHEKGPKARPCPHSCGARVLGCTLASAVARTGACAGTHTSRTRRGAPTRRGGDGQSQRPTARGKRTRRAACVSTRAAAPAENSIPAWLEGRHHQRRHGASARRPGHPHGEGSGCPHLGGHGP
jgi:hypothetical protein